MLICANDHPASMAGCHTRGCRFSILAPEPIRRVDVSAAIEAAGHGESTFVHSRAGKVVAAIIPAENFHGPGECCCKHCPFNGNHA